MRKFLIPLAAAASTVALAAPAAAQWYPQPQPQPYGYGYQYPQPQPQPQPQPYGYGYQTPYQQPYQNPYQQQYQQPYGYSYGYQNQYQQQPYGNAYGYRSPYQPYGHAYGHASFGQVRATKIHIDQIQADLRRLAQYRMISRVEYNRRLNESRDIERRFYRNTRDGMGLTTRELMDVQYRVAHLKQRIARDIRDGRQWGFRW